MPRYKSRPTIVPWLSAKQDNREKRFIQVGDSLLFSDAFRSLHMGARYLYFCMAMESAGKRRFQFPTSTAGKYGIPTSSFWTYVQELSTGGFIEYRSNKHLRRANDYRFSEVWKSPLFRTIQRPNRWLYLVHLTEFRTRVPRDETHWLSGSRISKAKSLLALTEFRTRSHFPTVRITDSRNRTTKSRNNGK